MNVFEYGEREIAHLSKDKKMAAAIEAIGHIERQMRSDVFSSLVSSIVSQQISTAAARSVWARFNAGLAEITPRAVADAPLEAIHSFGVSFKKAGYIKSAAERALAGELDTEALSSMSDDDVVKELTRFDGIGVWTAEMLMIFSLGRRDVLSWGDLGIHRGMLALYGRRCADTTGKRVKREFFENKRKKYSPCGSTASIYLWAIAEGAGGIA